MFSSMDGLRIFTTSYVCHSILKAIEALRYGYSLSIGDSQKSFWYVWLPSRPLYNKLPFVYIFDSNMRISNVWNNGD